jgi:NAD+ synthase (glutamine-hydrolysing)
MARLRIAACQLNTVVGDLDGNVAAMLAMLEQAESEGCDLAVFPELAITGYPPEDLLLKPRFVADNLEALDKFVARTGSCAAVVGFVDGEVDLYNAAAVCANGTLSGIYRKRLLPNYSVFDEQRYFAPGTGELVLFVVGGVRVGVSICEDIWSPDGPVATQASGGAELIVNLNASPYYQGRLEERERMLGTRAADASCTIVYVNQVGGQDELVFDGASLVVDASGAVIARGPQFAEDLVVVDLDVRPTFRTRLLDPRGRAAAAPLASMTVTSEPVEHDDRDHRDPHRVETLSRLREVYEALVLGTRDYVHKNQFSDVVIGLSGGVDSSLVAAVAVDALGADHVHGVSMPSRFSSEGSRSDASRLAGALGIDFRTIAIEPAHEAFLAMLAPSFADRAEGLAEENIQARVRGVTLMALSNKFDWLVLTTGNKSEMATGFSTLYGDSAGGFAVIKDVPKLMVYALCRDLNARRGFDVIPEAVLTKPPSAELRPDQRDDQSLPPYEVLDPILEAYVERDLTAAELVEAGFPADVVRKVVQLVDRAEYKRRQYPPGVRVTPKAFGKDRRLPITNRYSG